VLFGGDVRAEGAQPLGERGVPAVDEVTAGDDGLALGRQAGQDKRRAAAQVVGDDVAAAQRRRPVHDRDVVVDLDLRAHLVQLGDQRVAAVEDRLADVAGAVGQRRHCHDRRLEVGREAGERRRDYVYRPHRLFPSDLQHRAVGRELHAHLLELPADHAEVVQVRADQVDLAAAGGGGHREHARVDPVGHHRVLDRLQLGDSVHGDEPGAAAGDLRAHLGEERDHVEHFGLLRRVVDDRGAGRERGRHHQVLGAGVGRSVQVQVRAPQAVGGGDPDDRLALVHRRAQPRESAIVEVKISVTEVAAADALDDGLAEPVQQRGHEQDRAAEPPRDLGRQHRRGQRRGVHHQGALRLVELNLGAHRLRELDRAPHVLDRRDVAQHGPALVREQCRSDHLQGRVLGALDEHRALQRCSAADAVADLGALGHVDTTPVPGRTARTAHSVSAPVRTRVQYAIG
jgi:hypothetical protein